VIGAGLAAAVTWNLVTWRLGLPSSSGHALVGELVGAAAVVEGGVHAINWGGIEHWRPVGVFGILIGLALSPVLGGVAALLLTAGQIDTLAAPTWAKVVCAAALTAGTALGGWRIIATVGRRIYRIRPEEALSSQTASAGVIFGSSLLGAPVSTTQVVASSVGRDRRRPAPLAPRALGGRAQHGPRVADHHARVRGARCRGARAVAGGDVTPKRWFLPETPDVLAMLRRQMAITIDGVDAFTRWAGGDAAAAQGVRDAEHQGDVAKRPTRRLHRPPRGVDQRLLREPARHGHGMEGIRLGGERVRGSRSRHGRPQVDRHRRRPRLRFALRAPSHLGGLGVRRREGEVRA
jgi:hypothetical protein